jgi:hypothetical protein
MFVVDWEQSASDEFAAISMFYMNRWPDINAADSDIDTRLRRNPLQYSQPWRKPSAHRFGALGCLFLHRG